MDDANLLQNQIMKRLQSDQQECWYRRYTIKFDQKSFETFGIPTDGIDLTKSRRWMRWIMCRNLLVLARLLVQSSSKRRI